MKNKKTREEVEKLKDGWIYDPCWDLHTTEGFEEYEQELLEFEINQKVVWDKKLKEKMKRRRKIEPAFPLIEPGVNYDGEYNGSISSRGGLTKREYFAGLAMQGWIANSSPDASWNPLVIAQTAVECADALLEELAL